LKKISVSPGGGAKGRKGKKGAMAREEGESEAYEEKKSVVEEK